MVWIFIEEFEDLIVIFCPSFPILLFLKHPFLLCVLQVQQTHQWHQGVQRTGPVSCVCITLFHTISCKHKIHSHFFFFLMPPFSILLIYIPGLLFKDFNCHFSICVYPLGKLHCETSPFSLYPFSCFPPVLSSIRRLPPMPHLCFYPHYLFRLPLSSLFFCCHCHLLTFCPPAGLS